jgi:hypothetical protein
MKNKMYVAIAIIVGMVGMLILISGLFDKKEIPRDEIQMAEETTTSDTTTTTTTTTTKKVVKTTKKTTKKVQDKFTKVATASKAEYMAYAKQKGGYNDTQMQCLDWLWEHESHWNPNDYNEKSGVCGIPQAYQCSIAKYYGTNTWEHQIMWGVDYICREYNCNPCKAWNHYKNSRPHSY